jgi:GntP family gluconate:H+ symporter
LILTVYVIVPLLPSRTGLAYEAGDEDEASLPPFWASIAGPLVTVALLALRPIFGINIDPMIALPVGGIVGILTTRSWAKSGECISFGLEKMSTVAILLVGTGTIAGVIKASEIKDVLINLLSGWEGGGVIMAPLSSMLMSAATASTTAGATIASASFAQTVLGAGVAAVWAAAMTNAGATVLDHLPHGSFFHATGGSVGMSIKERMKLIPYETLVGLVLTLLSLASYFIIA